MDDNVLSEDAALNCRGLNCCIDYLKVRFNGSFSLKEWDSLWGVLLVERKNAAPRFGACGYMSGYELGEELNVFYGGEYTRNDMGQETWLLEMKGSACRRFEERAVFSNLDSTHQWALLLQLCCAEGGVATRIDLPTDDFAGLVPLRELQEKVARRDYVSRMSSVVIDQGNSSGWEFGDPADVMLSKNRGWTATLGTRKSIQLCMYNKAAERESKGYALNVSSWIRYEVRYYHDCAVQVLPLLAAAYTYGYAFRFISGCLLGCIRFVDRRDRRDRARRCPTWGKWASFTSKFGDLVDIRCQAKAEMTLATNAQWLELDASKALARVIAFDPSSGYSALSALANSGFSKLDNCDLHVINDALVSSGREPYADLDAMRADFVKGDFDILKEPPSHVSKLLKRGIRLGSAKYKDPDEW